MKSLLVKIASFAVMVHMTFGCSMHHGLGTNACAHQHETVCEHDGDSSGHDDDHEHQNHHQRDHDRPLGSEFNSELVGEFDGNSHSHHAGCCDDGCNATQSVQFQFTAFDFSAPCFAGGDSLALIEHQSCAGFDGNPIPDCRLTGGSVRAHLLLGVQIL